MHHTRLPYTELHMDAADKPGNRLWTSIHLNCYPGQPLAITGGSGSGKSTLLKVLAGQAPLSGSSIRRRIPQKEMLVLTPRHHFRNRSNLQAFYYQQRYHSTEVGQAALVREYYEGLEPLGAQTYWTLEKVSALLDLQALLDKPCIALSNGETRRVMLGAALLRNPAVLLMDDPILGLDKARQNAFEGYLHAISEAGIQIIISCPPAQVPGMIRQVALIENKTVQVYSSRDPQLPGLMRSLQKADQRTPIHAESLREVLPGQHGQAFSFIVRMRQVGVQYAGQQVLKDVSWSVRPGERWSLSGPNGAGKSTLLSLINGDNPQAYSNDITLFDRRRGSGESIWDIKRHIGYVSPELHQYFPVGQSAAQVIGSGYFETQGLYRSLSEEQSAAARKLCRILDIEKVWEKPFQHLSASEQRLCLLARALVKNPVLLILDEPTQGLDAIQTANFLKLIDQLCRHTSTTLIYVTHQTGTLPACITHHLEIEQGRIKTNQTLKPIHYAEKV